MAFVKHFFKKFSGRPKQKRFYLSGIPFCFFIKVLKSEPMLFFNQTTIKGIFQIFHTIPLKEKNTVPRFFRQTNWNFTIHFRRAAEKYPATSLRRCRARLWPRRTVSICTAVKSCPKLDGVIVTAQKSLGGGAVKPAPYNRNPNTLCNKFKFIELNIRQKRRNVKWKKSPHRRSDFTRRRRISLTKQISQIPQGIDFVEKSNQRSQNRGKSKQK